MPLFHLRSAVLFGCCRFSAIVIFPEDNDCVKLCSAAVSMAWWVVRESPFTMQVTYVMTDDVYCTRLCFGTACCSPGTLHLPPTSSLAAVQISLASCCQIWPTRVAASELFSRARCRIRSAALVCQWFMVEPAAKCLNALLSLKPIIAVCLNRIK